VSHSSRRAIDLSASLSDDGSSVEIDFNFLDHDDGGMVEILYQGDPKEKPILTGSIMGAPKGMRPISGHISLDSPVEHEEDEDEGEWGWWKRWLSPTGILGAAAVISTAIFGPTFPLSVILYTIIAEIAIGAAFLASMTVFLKRSVVPKFFEEISLAGSIGVQDHR
jgi:hypothetical protein